MSISVCVGGDSDAVMYSVSDNVLSVLYKSFNAANSADSNDGSVFHNLPT